MLEQESASGSVSVGALARQLSAAWKLMTPEQRRPYQDLAERDKERYEQQKQAYEAGYLAGYSAAIQDCEQRTASLPSTPQQQVDTDEVGVEMGVWQDYASVSSSGGLGISPGQVGSRSMFVAGAMGEGIVETELEDASGYVVQTLGVSPSGLGVEGERVVQAGLSETGLEAEVQSEGSEEACVGGDDAVSAAEREREVVNGIPASEYEGQMTTSLSVLGCWQGTGELLTGGHAVGPAVAGGGGGGGESPLVPEGGSVGTNGVSVGAVALFNPTSTVKVTKTKKRRKNPDMPRRSMSAFLFYSLERRPMIKAQKPHFGAGKLAQCLAEEWKELKAAQKDPYELMAFKDKERYKQEIQAYREGVYTGSGVTPREVALSVTGRSIPPSAWTKKQQQTILIN